MSVQAQRREEFERQMRAYVGIEAGTSAAPDPVNEPMIRHWCAALGDENPVYRDPGVAKSSVHGGIVAPPAMLNAWTMPPYVPPWDDPEAEVTDREQELHQLMGRYGYTGVVATDHDQVIERYLRPGDRVTATKRIEAISEEKATPLGIGYFIDVLWTFRDQEDRQVGSLRFRTLRYRPAQEPQPVAAQPASTKPTRLRPPKGHDNAWWWDGIDRGELLIQQCSSCGALRHPPRPMCGECQSLEWETLVSQGAGTVYSYTVMHHPPIPGYEYPFAVALVELDEGTRLVANVLGCDPSEVHIGMRVQARIENVDDEMKLPMFHPVK